MPCLPTALPTSSKVSLRCLPYKEKSGLTHYSLAFPLFSAILLSGGNSCHPSNHTTTMPAPTTTVPTPTAPVANPPIATAAESMLNRAKSIVGQTPRLDGVVKRSRLSKEGETVTTFNGFDWDKVPAKIRPRVMAAVRFVMAAEAEERAIAAHAKAEAAFSELL